MWVPEQLTPDKSPETAKDIRVLNRVFNHNQHVSFTMQQDNTA